MRCLALAPDRRRCTAPTRLDSHFCDGHQDWARLPELHPIESGIESLWLELASRLRGLSPRRLVPDPGKYKLPEAIRKLAPPNLQNKLLFDPENIVRWQAAFALRKRRDPAAVEPLWEALTSDDSRLVRQQVAVALGKLRTPLVLAPLIQALWHDPDPGVRQAAAIALGNLGSSRAGDELALALEQETDPFVRWDCILALGRVGNQTHIPLLRRLLEDDDAEYARQASRQALDLLLSR